MSAAAGIDLSGQWNGIYNYPMFLPPNSFEATIRDTGGLITGIIVEPGDDLDAPGTIRHAVIEGSRQGRRLSFVKIYDAMELDVLHYEGMIDPGGDEIEGEWTIPGKWSGTFLMIRGSKAQEEMVRRIEEKVR